MEMSNCLKLSKKLQSLTVFRAVLDDEVIKDFCAYLTESEVSRYCQFVSKLYAVCAGNLAKHVKSITLNSENVFVKMIGQGVNPPAFIKQSVDRELAILQEIIDLSPEKLTESLSGDIKLPSFEFGAIDIAKSFYHRVENIGKFGYGEYAKNKMFYINDKRQIVPVKNPDSIRLDSLIGYDEERQTVIANTKALLLGRPALNVLLTGDAGTGKSSTIKAICNELYEEGLRIIEIRKNQLSIIPQVLDELALNPLKFILFIDDLSFQKDDDNFNALKAVLEGSVSAKSKNVVIYATSNRTHIIKEKFSDREGDDVHLNDTVQEMVSLSERFGIHVHFQKPSKAMYLNIVKIIARNSGVDMADSQLELLCERYALERGGRSARLAKQFVEYLLSTKN